MKEDKQALEQRLQSMKNLYYKIDELIDKMPDSIPGNVRSLLKDKILQDKDLKELMDAVDSHRPPRIFLIGRTGVGKSSLINALCGSYVARVSDTKSCTEKAVPYEIKDGNRVLMEILDTRGIAESERLDNNTSAEDMLIEQIKRFSPDVAILVLNCTHRDDVNSDAEFLKRLAKEYEDQNSTKLPIVVVINKCDEMAPARLKSPSEYSHKKIDKIEEVVHYYKEIIMKKGLRIDSIIAVSSLIEWMTPDGTAIDVEDIDNLPKVDIENLKIAFDGRYKIQELLDILLDAIPDLEAQMGLRMAARLTEVVRRISTRLVSIFSSISGILAATPVPVSDIYILTTLQSVLVCFIALLSGQDISLENAGEFILCFGGVTTVGFGFRLLARQATKLSNVIFKSAGTAISGAVAAFGTNRIGKAAIAYYIDGKDLDAIKNKFHELTKKKTTESS